MMINISPDFEKAKSIKLMIEDRETFLREINLERFSTIAAENYYEIIKELATAIILTDGLKSIGENAHKDLIDYLINYNILHEEEIFLIHDLRIKRNLSSYEGKQINKDFLTLKKKRFTNIINKLKEFLDKRL